MEYQVDDVKSLIAPYKIAVSSTRIQLGLMRNKIESNLTRGFSQILANPDLLLLLLLLQNKVKRLLKPVNRYRVLFTYVSVRRHRVWISY